MKEVRDDVMPSFFEIMERNHTYMILGTSIKSAILIWMGC